MSRTEMLMVFCYDVTRSAARRKVAAVLEDHATRVQKSVFEARMAPARAERVAKAAAAFLEAGDSLRVYAVAAAGRGSGFLATIGAGEAPGRCWGRSALARPGRAVGFPSSPER